MAESDTMSEAVGLQEKTCRSCGETKSTADYYTHPKASDGLLGICKECHKRRMRENARTNPAVQARDKERAKLPHRKALKRAVTLRWRAENPDAYKAQTAVGNAIRDGKLSKGPCAICGAARVHAHHRDYAKPLDVVWLCAKCHHRLHAVFPEMEGANKKPRIEAA